MDVCDNIQHIPSTDNWLTYTIYVPSFITGISVCFFGFQMSRRLRFVIGFCMSFYATLTLLEGTGAQDWVILLVSFFVGLAFGPVPHYHYKIGIIILGLAFGGSISFVVIVIGLVNLWCGSDFHAGWFILVIAIGAAIGIALNYDTQSKNRRRHIVIIDTSVVGSFVVIQSIDAFVGKYWGFANISKCDCRAVDSVSRQMCGYFTLLAVVGMCSQYLYWYQGRRKRHDSQQMMQMYTI
eukprot:c20762_g1_i1.p1 GENE.c20762_g1_i1~~c20762_g1_i1.p1  ORF type:complete len:238 (+),score=41.93 c20762_g1_i1:80-793(+)